MINKIKTDMKVLQLSFSDSIKTIFTDSGALLILIFAAVFYPVVYSIAYNNQVVREIPTVIVDNDNTALSRQWCKMLDATPELKIVTKTVDIISAEELFWKEQANAIVLISNGFEKDVLKGNKATVSLYADASNFLLYKETLKSTLSANGTFAAGIEYKKYLSKVDRPELAISQMQPFKTSVYNLFNPAGSYGSFVMPGLMLLIIQQTLLIGIGLVGGAGRERKRSTHLHFGFHLVDHAFAAITGKSLAYFLIGLFNVLFASIFIYHWFSFPAKGEFFNLMILAVPFLLSTVFMGMSISLLFKHREHAIIALVFLSPIVLFASGLSWPVESMPAILHTVFKIFPSTYAIPAFIRLRTMGVSIVDIKSELLFLIIQVFVYYVIAGLSFKWVLKHKGNIG